MQFVHVSTNPIATITNSYAKDWRVLDYSHSRSVKQGFSQAIFDLVGPKNELEEMFYAGTGRLIQRYSPDGNLLIFEGQIIEQTLTLPGQRTRISLLDLYNRISVRYTALDTTANPPTETQNSTTADANDTTSQAKYGIKELVYKPPTTKLKSTEADQLRDTVIDQYREPRRDPNVVTNENRARLHVVCRGFADTLLWRAYNQTASSGTQNASTQIADILTAVGQFISSTRIETNTTQVHRYTNDDLTAYDQIQSIAALGDSSFNRWIAYIGPGRVFYYRAASTAVAYYRRMSDTQERIYNLAGRNVPKWEIEPDRWILTSDIQPFATTPAALEDNKSAIYIETVEWSENTNEITISGSQTSKPGTMIARLANQGVVLL